MKLQNSEQERNNQNHAAEREIGFLANNWRRQMTKKVIPKRLWDFGIFYESELLSILSRGKETRTRYEDVTGQTPEIGEYFDFYFYNIVWYIKNS